MFYRDVFKGDIWRRVSSTLVRESNPYASERYSAIRLNRVFDCGECMVGFKLDYIEQNPATSAPTLYPYVSSKIRYPVTLRRAWSTALYTNVQQTCSDKKLEQTGSYTKKQVYRSIMTYSFI